MTTLSPAPAPAPVTALRWALADGIAVTQRNLYHWIRQPQLIVFSTIQPIMFVLLFNYVFGGALDVPGVDYTVFLIPGIFAQVVAFGATQTAVGLAEDTAGGMVDRFRSLPMARSAVLVGRTAADAVRGLFVVALITLVAHLIGFRFQNGFVAATGAVLIVVAFGFALSWIFANVGLSVRGGAEAAQAASFVWIFPLVFASSAFVPTQTMPGWLRAFADHQPVTRIVDAVRALVIGGDEAVAITGASVGESVLWALAWIAVILAVFVPLGVRRYRRMT